MQAEARPVPKTLTILDLRDSPWVDGPGRTILDCGASLQEKGFRFLVGSFNGGSQKTSAYGEEAQRRGLELFTINESRSFDFKVIGQILDIIDSEDVDIIHSHDFRSDVFGLLCAKMRGKPVVSTVHGWIKNDLKGEVYTAIDKFLLRFFNKVITVSNRTRGLVVSALVPKRKIIVIQNALRVENYRINRNEQKLRSELGIDADTILVGNIGRLSAEKGQLNFLKAGDIVRRSGTKIMFVLIGTGPDQEELERYVSNNGLNGSTLFAGFRDDMIDIYNSLDLVVQSSFTEGMPNVVLEASLMGVPVIATDVGGTAEIIENGVSGTLVRPGLINDLAIPMQDFVEHREKYLEMAKQARRNILANFDHRKRVEKLDDLYQGLIAQQS
jgi:glycosyltransferase involved in cell wall biosynthesis